MRHYENKGTFLTIRFMWQDKNFQEYETWAEAKQENRGRGIYLIAQLRNANYGDRDTCDRVFFTNKPTRRQVEKFIRNTYKVCDLCGWKYLTHKEYCKALGYR